MPSHSIKTRSRRFHRSRGMYDYDSVVRHMKRRHRFMLGLVFLVMLLVAAAILIAARYLTWDR